MTGTAEQVTQPSDPLQAQRRQLAELGERARVAGQRLAEINPTVTSEGGAVTLTVGAGGVLTDLRFGAAAKSMELPALAALVLQTSQHARRLAAEQMQQALSGLAAGNSAAQDLLRREAERIEGPATPADSVRPADADGEDGFAGRGR